MKTYHFAVLFLVLLLDPKIKRTILQTFTQEPEEIDPRQYPLPFNRKPPNRI